MKITKQKLLPLNNTTTDSINLYSSNNNKFKKINTTIPKLIPTNKQKKTIKSFFRTKNSIKYKTIITSLKSLSILKILKLLKRL